MALPNICCHPGDGAKTLNRLPQLAKPRLRFKLSEEIRQLRQQESWRRGTGRSSKTLVKYPDLRLVLVAMKPDTIMKEHRRKGGSRSTPLSAIFE